MKTLSKPNILVILISFGLTVSFTFSTKYKTKKEFAFIPSGIVQIHNNSKSVQSFYILKSEVTNKQYLAFLYDIKSINEKLYQSCLPDTNKWNAKNTSLEPYKSHYFRHPAYEDYPVVNVSKHAAEEYCKWYTEKYNSKRKSNKQLLFRLPTEEEFVRAARGDNHQQIYAWENNSVRNKKGQFQCNHVHIDNENNKNYHIDNAFVIAPSKSYWPNQFGIYNLNGNVAELIGTKNIAMGGSWNNDSSQVTNESYIECKEPSPTIGFRIVATVLTK